MEVVEQKSGFHAENEESDVDEGFQSLIDSFKGNNDESIDEKKIINFEKKTTVSHTSQYQENRTIMTGDGQESRTVVRSQEYESKKISSLALGHQDPHERHSGLSMISQHQQNKTNYQSGLTSLENSNQPVHSNKDSVSPKKDNNTDDTSWMKIPISRAKPALKKGDDKINPTLQLDMVIVSGENLVPMDLNGFSDPYVKVFHGDTVLFKSLVDSKTLKPVWNDGFKATLPNASVPLLLQVFDHDKTFSDDFMGEVEIHLDSLELNKFSDITVGLNPGKDKKLKKQVTKKNKSLGNISIRIKLSTTIIPAENVNVIEDEQEDKSNEEEWKTIHIMKEHQTMTHTEIEREFSEGISSIEMLVEEIAGKDWLGLDLGGKSDPYIKIMQNNKILHKSSSRKKTVDPVWNHSFKVRLEDPTVPLHIKVFDKDWTPTDDFMGEAIVDLTQCQLDNIVTNTFQLEPGNDECVISEFKKRGSIGSLSIRFKLSEGKKMDEGVKQKEEKAGESGGLLSFLGIQKVKRSFSPTLKDEDECKMRQANGRTAVVHLVLVEAIDVLSEEEGLETDPYCKIRLGKEKKTSKGINNSLNKQGFDFSWKEEDTNNFLKIDMFSNTDNFVGCIDLDLLELKLEESHNIWLPLKGSVREGEGEHGRIHIIVTISGSVKPNTESCLRSWNPRKDWEAQRKDQYRMSKSFQDKKDVGMLTVKVLEARGLYGADWDFNSDTLAVVELKNQRLCTHTMYNTLAPSWMKVFTFKVEDINDILEISVFNEKNNGTFSSLGQEKIHLLCIQSGDQKWYKLKDDSCLNKAKGNEPEILLEMYLHWNPIRASLASLQPEQVKYEEKPKDMKFKLATLKHNKNRLKAAYQRLNPVRTKQELQSILSWENKKKSAFALLAYIYFIWIFQPWMFFLILLIPFILNMISGKNIAPELENEEEEDEVEEKKSLKEQWQTLLTYSEKMQNILGTLAHTIEKVENLFNFSVPFLSLLAVIALSLVTLIVYTFSLRLVLIFLGVKKMLNRLIVGPTPNKFRSFLSRVPDNEQMNQCRELGTKEGTGSQTPRRRSTFFLAKSSSAVSMSTLANDSPDDQIPTEFFNLMDNQNL